MPQDKKPFDTAAADAAATEFKTELAKLPAEQREPLAALWKRLYMRSGHGRLARILIGTDAPRATRVLEPATLDLAKIA